MRREGEGHSVFPPGLKRRGGGGGVEHLEALAHALLLSCAA